jgi:hypothetical protein
MSEGLILMPDQPWQRPEKLFRTNDYFVMICLEGARNYSRIFEFIRFTFSKGHRESLDWFVNQGAHHRRYRRRIDSAGQKHSERDVRH